jgi:glycosyltransferase involved in cell wall biosynthesis
MENNDLYFDYERYPLVSIIIPTFNRPESLLSAINSVSSQTYKNMEVIIIDDCSQEDMQDVVLRAKKKTNINIFYFKNSNNLGNAGARNQGIKLAKGDYIAFLDDDDIWLPEKIKKQVDLLLDGEYKACFCGTKWMEHNIILKEGVAVNNKISFENGGPTSTWLLHKSVFDEIGLFDSSFPSAVDGEFLVRLNKKYKVCFVYEALYIHYYYNDQISASNQKKINGFEMMLKKHQDNFNKHELASIYFKLSIFYLFNGIKRFDYLLKSIKYKINIKNIILFLIFIIPGNKLSKFILNQILDIWKYPKTFAGRYNK